MIRTVNATRYLVPLREGGSLPAIVEADDGELYVMKFSGAGQGPKVLIAELVAGSIGQALGLNVPELVFMELDPVLGRNERDQEISSLLQASAGLNLGLRYLPSSFAYNPLLAPPVDAALASAIVWFDALITNVDRTPRNPNLLRWHDELWLIDQGAAFYFHYDWTDYKTRAETPFALIKQHVLIGLASEIEAADQQLRPQLTELILRDILAQVPALWLGDEPSLGDPEAHRAAYVDYLLRRLAAASNFVQEAVQAHAAHV